MAKLMPADFRPCDIGYTRIGIWVEDFDATLTRLAGLGSQPLTEPFGERGGRRACVRNPDGVYVEVMEDDPLPQSNPRGRVDCPSAIRSVTVSVPQIADAAAFFEEGIGLNASTVALHTPEHEALWGLAGATTESRLFDGGEVLIEVVQYLNPAGKPRSRDYRISDQGILNIAFGARRKSDFSHGLPTCRSVWGHAQLPTSSPTRGRLGGLRKRPARPFSRDPTNEAWTGRPDLRIRATTLTQAPGSGHAEDRTPDQDQRTSRQSLGNDHRSRQHGRVDRFRSGHGAQRRLDTAPRRRFRTPDARPARSRPGRGASDSHQPAESLRYRVIEGSPLTCHQGEITLKHSDGHTELHWSIRFRPKVAGTGAVLQKVLQAKLRTMLDEHLKPYIEKNTAAGVFTTPEPANTETAAR